MKAYKSGVDNDASLACVCASAALALFACASTPSYVPAKNSAAVGYSETAIESNRYRVSYRGGSSDTARDFALLRAAELTLAKGQEWFRVTNSSTEDTVGNSKPQISVGGATGNYGSGVGLGIALPIGGNAQPALQTFEIVMGSGPKPNDPDVYDAMSVSQSIRARIGKTGG